MKRRLVMILALLILITVSGEALAGAGPAHKDIPEAFKGEAALGHIQALATASRVAGTPGEYQAILYYKSFFEGLGYETQVQEFPIWYFEEHGCSLDVVSPAAHAGPVQANLLTYSAPGDVEAGLVYCHLGKAEDFAGLDVAGKIALIRRGDITFLEKTRNAYNNGAVGVIIFNRDSPDNFFGTLQEPVGIPALSISGVDGGTLLSWMADGPVTVRLVSDTVIELRTSHNVVASKKPARGKGTGKVVLVGAHIDSVAEGPGANDNASGVAVALEVARVLQRYDLMSEVRFLVFGAEELSLVGSEYYAASLTPGEVANVIGMFNLDMVGIGDVCSSGNIGNEEGPDDGDYDWLVNLAVNTAGEMGLEMLNEKRGTNSDHYPFEALGIPVDFVTWRPDPYYHTADDTVDKIIVSDLDWVGDVVASNVFDLAKTPLPKSIHGILAKSHKYTSTYMGRECYRE